MADHSIHDERARGRFVTAEALAGSGMDLLRGFQDGTRAAPRVVSLQG